MNSCILARNTRSRHMLGALIAAFLTLFGVASAQAGIAEEIDSILRSSCLRRSDVAVLIEKIEPPRVLYERHPDAALVPASNMKIVTGAAALSLLGPNYRYVTVVATDAATVEPHLSGNLYVRGSGDPSLVSEELWKMAEAIDVLGIDTIEGDLVLDDSCFDTLRTTSAAVANGHHAYEARTGGLSLNFNAIAVHVTPGPHPGSPAVVAIAPSTAFVEIRNRASTASARRSTSIDVVRSFEDGRNTVSVTGGISRGSAGKVIYRNLERPPLYFGTVMKEFLAAAGISLMGSVRMGQAPEGVHVLTTHESKPLALMVRDLNKFSNNFTAEQLTKTLSAEVAGPPGTTEGGARVLEDFLARLGADSLSYSVADGSGFSRDNRLSPRTVVRVLRHTLDDFARSYEFVSSLSVGGTDGTLEDRMGYVPLERMVRAKTGLLDGVSAISGIAHTASDGDVLFSIIINGFRGDAWEAHRIEEAILSVICNT